MVAFAGMDVPPEVASALGRAPYAGVTLFRDHNVTSVEQVRALTRGTFRTGGDASFDLRNGGVGLGKISPKVPRSFIRQVNRVRSQIIAGKIEVPSTLGSR